MCASGRRRAVGAFDDQLGLDVVDVLFGDLFLERGGDEDVDVELEDVCLAERLAAGEAGHRLVLARRARWSFGMSRPLSFWTPPFQSVTPMIFAPCSAISSRADRADVAEALHGDARALELEAEMLRRLARHDHHAAAGRLAAAERSAHLDRLAGDDRRRAVADVHRVGVGDPRHDLFVGVDVGRRDVLVGADRVDDLGGVAARQRLELALRHLASGRR